MKRLAALLCILLLCQINSPAQAPEPHEKRPRTVTVRGTGTLSLPPDQVRVSIQVNVRGESASSAMNTASTRTRDVLDILQSYGVDTKNLRTTRISVSPIYDYEKRIQPPPIVGYMASNDFVVTFVESKMDRVGEFLDRAVTAGASNFGSLIYESTKQRELERDALINAAADARARAEVLAKELGANLGRVLSITEVGLTPPVPIVQDMVRTEASVAAPVMVGEITISAKADVVFELKEPNLKTKD